MKIKNITDFTIEECRMYLEQNPNGPLTKDVQNRLNILLEEIAALKEEERQATIAKQDELSKIEWIDINQFLEDKNYKRHRFFRGLLFMIMFIAAFLITNTIYYSITEHYMYESSSWDQARCTSGIESLLLHWDFIETPYYWDDDNFTQGYETYQIEEGIGFAIAGFVITVIILLINSLFHSPILPSIYNIEKTDYKKNKFVVVQNRSGEMGICRCDKFRIVSLLRCDFTKIYSCNDNAYIVNNGTKFGVFNAALRKIVIPVIYDSIEIEGKDRLLARKNKIESRFTTKGYRIVS